MEMLLNKTPPAQVFLGFREDLEARIAKLKGAACLTRVRHGHEIPARDFCWELSFGNFPLC